MGNVNGAAAVGIEEGVTGMALLTIERIAMIRRLTGARVAVFLGDEDITQTFFVADDQQHYAGVYRLRKWRRGWRAALEVGAVRFVWIAPDGYVWRARV